MRRPEIPGTTPGQRARERLVTLKFSFAVLPENSKVAPQTAFLPPTGFEIRQKPEAPPSKPITESTDGENPAQLVISRI